MHFVAPDSSVKPRSVLTYHEIQGSFHVEAIDCPHLSEVVWESASRTPLEAWRVSEAFLQRDEVDDCDAHAVGRVFDRKLRSPEDDEMKRWYEWPRYAYRLPITFGMRRSIPFDNYIQAALYRK